MTRMNARPVSVVTEPYRMVTYMDGASNVVTVPTTVQSFDSVCRKVQREGSVILKVDRPLRVS